MPVTDTIAAPATPAGIGGIGVIRVSGPLSAEIARCILGNTPVPRIASFSSFSTAGGEVIDEGIALFFSAPRSFTGEDVLELQGHGGPVVMDLLMRRVLELGARPARPGEFTERAFLNGKLDLVQAEAVADLIESGSETAARLAVRTLEGEFSRRIKELVAAMIGLRVFVEAAIDFPDDEIDYLSDKRVSTDLQSIVDQIKQVQESARVGRLLRDGMHLVIAGPPNAGKSSLLNALAGRETAIVTEIPGTTRDLLREYIQIDGLPLHLVDTAGLRTGVDVIEREGIKRAREQIDVADLILWVFDDQADPGHDALERSSLPPDVDVTLVRNKIDLTGTPPGHSDSTEIAEIRVSAVTGAGIEDLRKHLKQRMGYRGSQEGEFIARRRHLDALDRAQGHLVRGQSALKERGAGELLAEDLREAQKALSEITGEFTPDDLLGEIFSRFCIGK